MSPKVTVPIIALTVVAMIYVVMRLFVVLSRWNSLRREYQCDSVPDGNRRLFQSAFVNDCQFRASLSVIADPSQLVLAPMFPFSLFMKPVRIPTSDLQLTAERKFGMAVIRCEKAYGASFALPGNIAKSLALAKNSETG